MLGPYLVFRQARSFGAKTYLGALCGTHGHGHRYRSSSQCVDCTREKNAANAAVRDKALHAAKQLERYHRTKTPQPKTLLSRAELRERSRQRKAAWARENPEHIKTYAKEYLKRIDTPERRAAAARKARAWLLANPERARARARAWVAENPDRAKALHQARRAREVSAEGRFTEKDIQAIRKVQRGLCAYSLFCEASLSDGEHIDHVIPLARGGSNWPWNIQLTCPKCNLRKNASDPLEFLQRLIDEAA